MLNEVETGFYFPCLNRTQTFKQLYKSARRKQNGEMK